MVVARAVRGGVLVPSWRSSATAAASVPAPAPVSEPKTSTGLAPSGVLGFQFGTLNLGASQTALALYRAWPGSGATLIQAGVLQPYRGHVLAMMLRASASISAGQASFEVYLEAVASGAVLTWTSSNREMVSFAPDTYTFEARNELDVRVTTDSSFAPTSADVELIVVVSFLPGE